MGTINDIGTALWTSLVSAMNILFAFVPKFLGFLVILLIGWLVASALAKGTELLLRRFNFDTISDRIGLSNLSTSTGVRMDAAHLLGRIVFWFVFLIFLVPACNALDLTSVSTLLNQVIAYIPNVFVAILVLFLGTLLASIVDDIVEGATARANIGNPRLFGKIAQYAIIIFAVLIALSQLQIAPALMQTLFTAIIGAIALAIGLAFGLGGRDTAQRFLKRSEGTLFSNRSTPMAATSGAAMPGTTMSSTGSTMSGTTTPTSGSTMSSPTTPSTSSMPDTNTSNTPDIKQRFNQASKDRMKSAEQDLRDRGFTS